MRQQIAQLTNLVKCNTREYYIPDPIKQLSECSGNRKELIIWFDEVDQLYHTFKVKRENGTPDSMNAHYVQATKNKVKGEARMTLCANGNPETIPEIKQVLIQHYGDQRDLATNLSHLFHTKRADRSNLKFYSDMKELSSKLEMNLTLNPVTTTALVEMLVVTKYLDNSIIRQSRPAALEYAYQAVCINQNADSRNRSAKKTFPHGGSDNINKNKSNDRRENKYDSKPNAKFVAKKPFVRKSDFKAKAEMYNRE